MIAWLTKHFERWAHRVPLFDPFFRWYYAPLVKEETRMARFKESDHILVIGGGSMPYSAFYLARYTKAHMTIIDCDAKAVTLGQRFIERKKMRRVRYILGCALAIDLSPYSAIHVAKQVAPKSLVMDRLTKEATKGTKVLLRQPTENMPSWALELRYKPSLSLVKSLCYYVV